MKISTKSVISLSSIILFVLINNMYGGNLVKGNSLYSKENLITNNILNEELGAFFASIRLAPPAPVVNSPVYLCQNSSASPLTATALSGHTLIWYGTASTGGTPSSTAPTPSTSSVGTTTYYVSQTDGVEESPRASIVVNVVADTGGAILNLRCDPSQILPADRDSSVFFDWSNDPLNPINDYIYTYTIQGGAPVTGRTGPTNLQVFGMQPGQTATLTLSHARYPCVPSQTISCTVPCGSATVSPDFPMIPPICIGSTAPILQSTSPNGISGTWSPAVVSNTVSGSYLFTPDPVLFPCATTQTLDVTVLPLASPVFNGIPSTVCQGSTAPILPTSSNNSIPITGTWSPSVVNTSVLGSSTYAFNPDPGQCVSTTPTTVTITVIPNNVSPTFTQVASICSGDALTPLPTTSNEGITGVWSPALNNTATTTYTFTPDPDQCALSATMTITVNPKENPTFAAVGPICSGDTLAPLPTTSDNGYTGSWSPALNNTVTTTYTFLPDSGQCANSVNLTITVNPTVEPSFNNIPSFVCENSGDFILPTISNNSPAITGTWSPSFVDSDVLGTVNYVFTPDAGQCASTTTMDITVKPSNNLIDFQWTVTEAFSENQVITISATQPGDYLYQLDSGSFQTSPVFENVSYGEHTVTVRDPDGCSPPITKGGIYVVDYPKFFTPNGDGQNDIWNISSLMNDVYAKILVFNRYGKLLKEIRPNGAGWNGSYNGKPMPADDYWFVIYYEEGNVAKNFRSHFSLKR
ncbi:T9SS type B sorting domain-containing protein [Flavobacteriaceae bacterium XHP0103]|uniref:T9SS type B sorting domain-containing protein n=1 Tax=Marixanthotalea marina TaxID=2844359 RepID=UPI002989D5BE|nr:T9SS type B sorting domain-containing protein [Marixanthotalea marina]MBU3821628.1 T9SS type B sorting domain-containing protein [Marixanthotalea marina]